MPKQRRRIKHTATLSDRLATEAERLRERARKMPRGAQREELLRKARQMDVATHMDEWLSSSRPQSRKQ
jgi:hypothetical protein